MLRAGWRAGTFSKVCWGHMRVHALCFRQMLVSLMASRMRWRSGKRRRTDRQLRARPFEDTLSNDKNSPLALRRWRDQTGRRGGWKADCDEVHGPPLASAAHTGLQGVCKLGARMKCSASSVEFDISEGPRTLPLHLAGVTKRHILSSLPMLS